MHNKNIILVIVAHPDDEVLGCGASMAKWSNDGNDVHVLIMAEGATSRDKVRDRKKKDKELRHLIESAESAKKIIGIKSVEFFNYPDNRMDSIDLLNIVKSIEEHISKLKPNMVVTHHSSDLNIDHQIINQAVMTACRPMPSQTVRSILSFEVPSATGWNSISTNVFSPNLFEDISKTINLKIKALNAYSSEMRKWPHARSIEAVDALAKWRGSLVGYKFAEAFFIERELR
jgi:N-acetylglucosamine malate deacetylase 1